MTSSWIIGFTVSACIILSSNSFAYHVNKDLLFDEESRFLSSKWTFNLDAMGLNSEAGGTDTNSLSLTSDIGANMVVEKTRTGYWLNGDLYVSHTRSENDTSENTTSNVEIKNYSANSVQGFQNFDWAEAGYKIYLTKQSPIYAFGQGLTHWYYTQSKNTDKSNSAFSTKSDDNGLEASVGVGIGYGKIVDLGSFERVLIVQNELIKSGLIKTEFPRVVVRELLPIFRTVTDKNTQMLSVQAILTNNGLIQAKELSLDIANDILNAIEESFEKREYGLEVRLGYLQEIHHEDSKEDKDGYFYGYVKYEKPLSRNHQFTSQLNVFYHAATEENNKELSIHWLSSVTRQYDKKLTRKIGLEVDYNKIEDVTTWEKLFLELEYEITDVLVWENEMSYTFTQYESTFLDDKQEYLINSRLVYSIW